MLAFWINLLNRAKSESTINIVYSRYPGCYEGHIYGRLRDHCVEEVFDGSN